MNRRTYAYLHDVLGNAVERLEGAERYAQGAIPLLGNALQHIRSALRQARAAILMSPRVRTQLEVEWERRATAKKGSQV